MKIYTRAVGPIATNCYIVADEDGVCAVIDPGAQAHQLLAFLEANKLHPTHVLLTHGHYDHIGAVKAIVAKFGCKLAIGQRDEEQLSDLKKSLAMMQVEDDDNYLMTADLLLKEGDLVQVGKLCFEVLDTPGHTFGGLSYRCGDALFTGDTIFAQNIGRTDLYGGSYQAIMNSVKKLCALEGDCRVLPGHGPETTLALERANSPYMKAVGYEGLH